MLCSAAANNSMQWKLAIISISFIVEVKPKPTESFISMQSEIPNHFSTYSHKIYYKTKLFRHPTLKLYVNES